MGAILFLISRLWFLNWGEVFFDSGEYLRRWAEPSLFSAIIGGHPPLHLGYVVHNWVISNFFQRLEADPLPVILVLQVCLALLSVYSFGEVILRLTDVKTARRAMILISVLPIFWIVNGTVTMETTYLFFFFASLFFLSRYTQKTGNGWHLLLVSVFWIMAFLTHTVVLIWIPFFIYLAWIWSKERFWKVMIVGVLSILTASIINAFFLSYSLGTNIQQGFYWLYAAKFGEHAWFSFDIETIVRYLRNWIVPLLYNNTSPLVILGFLSLLKQWKTSKKLFVLGLLWLGPSLIANQWWDSLLYGRHALIASFGLAFFAAAILNKWSFKLVFLLILVISLPALLFLRSGIPYQLMSEKVSTLPGGGLLIDSHFSRPYTEGDYFGETIYVDEPGWSIEEAGNLIVSYINNKRNVFVTGHALSEPYGLFSGPYLHPISLSYKNDYILEGLTDKWGFAEYQEIDRDLNLMIYKITTKGDKYPSIEKLDESKRRIDYYDPLRILISGIKGGLNL